MVIGDGRWSQLNPKHLSHKKQSLNYVVSNIIKTICFILFFCLLFSLPMLFPFSIQCTFDLSFTFIDILYVFNLEMTDWIVAFVGFRFCFGLLSWGGRGEDRRLIWCLFTGSIVLASLAYWISVQPFGI